VKIIDVDLDVVVAASVFVVPVFVAAVDSVGFGRNCDASPNANSIVLLPFPRSSSSSSSSSSTPVVILHVLEVSLASFLPLAHWSGSRRRNLRLSLLVLL